MSKKYLNYVNKCSSSNDQNAKCHHYSVQVCATTNIITLYYLVTVPIASDLFMRTEA